MKKILATILAFIYLSTSMGATIHFHYCMGKLVSWGLLDQKSKDCTSCGMPKKVTGDHCIKAQKGCCNDEHKQIKTDKDQKVVQSEFDLIKLFPVACVVNHPVPLDFQLFSAAIEYPASNGPPGIGKVPVFLLHRNFRI